MGRRRAGSAFSALPSTSTILFKMEKVMLELVRMLLVGRCCSGSYCGGDGLIVVGEVYGVRK